MNINSTFSFPYPVIGHQDDIEVGYCTIQPKIYMQEDILHIDNLIPFFQENEYFSELYRDRKIVAIAKVVCPSTLYCEVFKVNQKITIPQVNLANHFELSFFLIADVDIPDYSHSSFNSDYKDEFGKPYIFKIEKNNVIGTLGSANIPLSYSFKNGVSGLFRFKSSGTSPVSFDMDGDQILVYYPHEENSPDILNVLSRNGRMLLMNLFIIPALTEAFTLLMEQNKEGTIDVYKNEKQWAMIISESFPDFAFDDQPFVSAQKYLQRILTLNGKGAKLPVLQAFDEFQQD